MSKKIENVLRIVAILGIILAAWAIGINQVANILENAHSAQVRSAEAACVEYGAPHAVVADGVTYCYKIYVGTEQMIPLEKLQELYSEPTSGT